MKLVRCTECGCIIETDELEEVPMDTTMGCGLEEDNFLPCEGCSAERDPVECSRLRREKGFIETTLAALSEVI
jgi:hypothetical protein